MRLTILGSSASYANPGQACSGYLVEGGGARVLLDCGNGVLANLIAVADPLSLDAVLITHYHPDHVLDLFALQALLRYAPTGPAPALRVYAPAGLFGRMTALLSERGARELAEAFDVHDLVAGCTLRFGELDVEPVLVDHTDPTFAMRVRADGALLVYTADSAPGVRLDAAASGADLLLAEATLPEQYAGAAPHLTASEAGVLARDAGAGHLVLTHHWATNDRANSQRVAEEVFGGPTDVAVELATYDITPGGGNLS